MVSLSDLNPMMVGRTLFCVACFLLGCISIRLTQAIARLMFSNKPKWYYAFIQVLKTHFLVLITFITSIVSPCKIRITFHKLELPETTNFRVDSEGNLVSTLSPNAVLISNHQIYADWMFYWFLSYTANLSHSIYIVAKEALSKAPIVGQGMVNLRFLFLLRKWEEDKIRMTNQLLEIDAEARGYGPALSVSVVSSANSKTPEIKVWPQGTSTNPERLHPYHLILFPEGTVISAHTRARSEKYVLDMGKPPLKHVLLPRVRGLFLSLRLLRKSVDVVYDVAFGYAGLKPSDYGEDIFTLKAMFLMGKGPKLVNYHIRSFSIKDIPLGNDDDCLDIDKVDPSVLKNFEEWLYKVWYEKDKLMETFFETGSFVDSKDLSAQTLTANFKTRSWVECCSPFMTFGVFVLGMYWVLRMLFKAFFT